MLINLFSKDVFGIQKIKPEVPKGSLIPSELHFLIVRTCASLNLRRVSTDSTGFWALQPELNVGSWRRGTPASQAQHEWFITTGNVLQVLK